MEKKYTLKNRTRISSAIANEKYEELKKLSEDTSIPVSKLLDKAVDLLLIEYKDKR
ncbi:MAG: ribbon-helix-helix domain-containing protein [Terrisporobacter sp.]|uniref:ribbon-helix-helix domain-containing protein n=1 Tax=Terrisporobacter sp. TaxID=1965305 RepID=UPI002FC956E6